MKIDFSKKLNEYSLDLIKKVDRKICHLFIFEISEYYRLRDSEEEKEKEEYLKINKELNRLRLT